MLIISLGWGVQSFAMAAMSALGYLPKVDFAIHADTTHESIKTYEFAKKWTPWLENHGIEVYTVNDSKQAAKVTTLKTDPPFHTKKVVEFKGTPLPVYQYTENGNGQLMRQCTSRWKIVPMRRYISQKLKELGLKKTPGIVEQWIGFSLDEQQRAKPPDVKYIKNRWPLLELGLTRNDCINWLKASNIEVPTRSKCVFCPYQSKSEWRRTFYIKEDWEKAVMVDEAIRKVRPPYDLYVCNQRKPLLDCDFGQDQMELL